MVVGSIPAESKRAVAQWLERHSYKVHVGSSILPGTSWLQSGERMKLFKFSKHMSLEDVHTVAVELAELSSLVGKLLDENRQLKREIENVKTRIDQKVNEELDTVQKRYITLLEGKLIQFDQEAAKLKMDKDMEYHRLHGYFYGGGRP